jgi:uncharacterized protein (DUF302 family)
MTEYGYSVEVPQGYDEAVLRARLALRGEGFSILSEMHVGGMLGPRTGSERQYLIMGVYDSAISQKRIDNDLRAAVHLPCNLVIQENAGTAVVAALDPRDTIEEGTVPEEIVTSAREALGRVLTKVATESGES